MSASKYAYADVDELLEDVVDEDYQTFEDILDRVRSRRGGNVAPSDVRTALSSDDDYTTRIERLKNEGEIEVLYRKSD